MIDMPMVPSGTFSVARVVAGTDPADAVVKSAAVPEVESTWEVVTTGPHRIGAGLRLTLEDIATVGHAGFESMLRQHISLLVSDELDNQMINGGGGGANLSGVFHRLDNPSNPAANVETWTRFLAIQSGGIDGLWATELEHIGLVVGVETYQLAAATFQGTDSEESAASYLKRMGDRWGRVLHEQAHAVEGIEHPAGDLVSQGAVHDAGADANCGMSALGILLDRRHLYRRIEG